MRAADALIESLETEVEELRADLENAGGALRAAQEEVAARGTAVEEAGGLREALLAAEEEARALREDVTRLRGEATDEQLRLRNEHIASMAALREELEEQRRVEVAEATSESKVANLREEFRKERVAAEERHKAEVEELKRAAEGWEEKLRDDYRDLEERRGAEIEELEQERAREVQALQKSYGEEMDALAREHREEAETLRAGHRGEIESLRSSYEAELEALRRGVEEQKIEAETTLREELGRAHEEERRLERERHAAELQALRSAAAARELEAQKELRSAVEGRRDEVAALKLELDNELVAAEERRRAGIREIKRLAEGRERELRRTQAARLSEEKEEAERRAAALKAQREADVKSLRDRHAAELARLRHTFDERHAAQEKRLAEQDERHKVAVADLQERLGGDSARRESEARLYGERLGELEQEKAAHEKAVEEELERRLAGYAEEKARLEARVSELQDALEESGVVSAELRESLEEARAGGGDGASLAPSGEPGSGDLLGRVQRAEASRRVAEERSAELERRLARAEDEGRLRAEELEKALEDLRTFSDPELRLRAGISLFNASEHTRTVASISRAFGLPKVHVGADNGNAGKPVVTFVWGDMSWRRYVSDPTDGVEEPRVYLVGTGDDPSDDLRGRDGEPNARMDAKGRLILGVQAH